MYFVQLCKYKLLFSAQYCYYWIKRCVLIIQISLAGLLLLHLYVFCYSASESPRLTLFCTLPADGYYGVYN